MEVSKSRIRKRKFKIHLKLRGPMRPVSISSKEIIHHKNLTLECGDAMIPKLEKYERRSTRREMHNGLYSCFLQPELW